MFAGSAGSLRCCGSVCGTAARKGWVSRRRTSGTTPILSRVAAFFLDCLVAMVTFYQRGCSFGGVQGPALEMSRHKCAGVVLGSAGRSGFWATRLPSQRCRVDAMLMRALLCLRSASGVSGVPRSTVWLPIRPPMGDTVYCAGEAGARLRGANSAPCLRWDDWRCPRAALYYRTLLSEPRLFWREDLLIALIGIEACGLTGTKEEPGKSVDLVVAILLLSALLEGHLNRYAQRKIA